MKITKKVVCAVALIVLSVGVWKAADWDAAERAIPQEEIKKIHDEMEFKKLQASMPSMPSDIKGHVASFLERSSFKPWKTLKAPATTVVFNGSNLVSMYRRFNPNLLLVTVRSALNGNVLQNFTIPVAESGENFFVLHSVQAGHGYVWSADGNIIGVMNPDRKRIELWSTGTGTLVKSIPSAVFNLESFDENCRVLGLSNDGTLLFVRMSEKLVIPVPAKGQSGLIQKIKVLHINANKIMTLQESESIAKAAYTFSAHAFLAIPRYVPGENSTLIQWNLETGIMSITRDTKRIVDCCFNDDGTMLALTYGSQLYDLTGSVELFNYNFNNGALTSRRFLGSGNLYFAGFSHDANFCMTVSVRNPSAYASACSINLLATRTDYFLQELNLGYGRPSSITLSPDDTIMAISLPSQLQLWKKSTSLENALEKSERVKELRAKRARDASRAAARAEEESQTDMSSVD